MKSDEESNTPPCVSAGVYTLDQHNEWAQLCPHPWPCPACKALEDRERRVAQSERVPSVELLARAADLLAEEARATRDSCAGNDRDWACGDCKKDENGKCAAQRIHERLANTADELRGFA